MTSVATHHHSLLDRLTREFGYAAPSLEAFDAFCARVGDILLFFADDPVRSKETLDLAVIVPEIARAFAGRLEIGVLLPSVANAVAPRYGIRRWPALVLLRNGKYVGAIESIRDWDEYHSELARLLESEPSTPPQIVVPLRASTTHHAH